jgi:hypothetical protein
MAYVTKKELEELLGGFEDRVVGLMKRQNSAFDARFEEIEEGIGEAIDNSGDDWLDDLISEAEDLDDDDLDDDDEDEEFDDEEFYDEDDDEYEDEPVATTDPRLLRQLKKSQQLIADLQSQLDADRDSRDEEREQIAYDRMVNSLEQRLQGQVANPRQFIALLDQEGLLVEADGQLMIGTEDEYGEDTIDPIDALEDLLDTDDYAHFAPARPGTGTGASQSGGNSYVPEHKRVHLKDGPMSDSDMLSATKDPEKFGEVLAELDSMYS